MVNNQAVAVNASRLMSTRNLAINYTISPGTYKWSITCTEKNNETWPTTERTLTVLSDGNPPMNTTPPATQNSNLTLISPAEGFSTTDTNVVFVYNLSIQNVAKCNLLVNNNMLMNSSNITQGQNSFASTLSVGSYTWNVTCSNSQGKNQSSISQTFTINAVPQPPASGGGGGSSGGSGGGGASIVRTSTNSTNRSSQNATTNQVLNSTSNISASVNVTNSDVPLQNAGITGAVVGTLKNKTFIVVAGFIVAIALLFVLIKMRKSTLPPHSK